jgi:hypothetical protein
MFATTTRRAHAHAGPPRAHPRVEQEQRRRQDRAARTVAAVAAAVAAGAGAAGARPAAGSEAGAARAAAATLNAAARSKLQQQQQQQQQPGQGAQPEGGVDEGAAEPAAQSEPAGGYHGDVYIDDDHGDSGSGVYPDGAANDVASGYEDSKDYQSGADTGYDSGSSYDDSGAFSSKQQQQQQQQQQQYRGGLATHYETFSVEPESDWQQQQQPQSPSQQYGQQQRRPPQSQRSPQYLATAAADGYEGDVDAFRPHLTSHVYGAHTEGAVVRDPADGNLYLSGSAYAGAAHAAVRNAARGRTNTFGTHGDHPLRRPTHARRQMVWAEHSQEPHSHDSHHGDGGYGDDDGGAAEADGDDGSYEPVRSRAAPHMASAYTHHHNTSAAAPPFGVESAASMRHSRKPAPAAHVTTAHAHYADPAGGDDYGDSYQGESYHNGDDGGENVGDGDAPPAAGTLASASATARALASALTARPQPASVNVLPPPGPRGEEPFHVGRQMMPPPVEAYGFGEAGARGRSKRQGMVRIVRTYRADDPYTMGQQQSDSATTGAPMSPAAAAHHGPAARLPSGRGLLPRAAPVLRAAQPIGHAGSMLQLMAHVLPAAGVTTPIDYGGDIMTNSNGRDAAGAPLQGRLCADESRRDGHSHPVVALMRDSAHSAPLTTQQAKLRRPAGASPPMSPAAAQYHGAQ